MARYTGPVCKLCRRERQKLFLKGERCHFKCAFERRDYPPGQHGQRRGKDKDYGIRLREKQKIRRIYGVLEKQFRTYFREAERQKGVTGDNLLRILESRFDNMVYRAGMAASRPEARQLVLHNHFTLNGAKVNIPSLALKAGDVIQVKEKSKTVQKIEDALEIVQQRGVPEWLELELDKMQVTVKDLPARDQVPENIEEQLVVELYSK